MSEQLTSQSRPVSGISRRTALRGAAWSASAVTVVVAVPAYAAASDANGFSGPTFSRQGSNVTAKVNFNLVRKSKVTAVMTVTVEGGSVASGTIDSVWTGSVQRTGASTLIRPADAAAGPVTFEPTVTLNNSSFTKVTFSITFTWDGGSEVVGGTYTK